MTSIANQKKGIWKYLSGESGIWTIVIVLSAFSLWLVYSATGFSSFNKYNGNSEHDFLSHLWKVGVGLGLMFFASKFPYKYYGYVSRFLIWLVPIILVYAAWYSAKTNDAGRWIEIFGIRFQASDLSKLVLFMYAASVLAEAIKKNTIKDKIPFIKIMAWTVVICGLIMVHNLSTAILIGLSVFMLMCLAGIHKKYLLYTFYGIVVGGLLFASVLLLLPPRTEGRDVGRLYTWKARVERFADKIMGKEVPDDQDKNFQAIVSARAISSGGIFGKGPGQSTQKYILPAARTDFIYAITVEEYGLIGGIFIIFLYFWLFLFSIRIGRRAKGDFGHLLAYGLAIITCMQAFFHIFVNIGFIPVTGQALPLLSWGGTSWWITSASIGIILSIGRHLEEEDSEEKQPALT